MNFKAIVGMLTPQKINVRLRELWEAFTKLAADVAELQAEAGIEPETTTLDESLTTTVGTQNVPEITTTAAPDAPEAPITPPGDTEFDWRASEDVEALKAFALEKFDLVIRKQKPETVKADIEAYLETQIGG